MESTGSQDGITLYIRCSFLLMDTTIDFHNHAGTMTVEINDKRFDHLLPPKMISGQAIRTKR